MKKNKNTKAPVIFFKLVFLLWIGLLVSNKGFAEDLAESRRKLYQQVEQLLQQHDTAKALAVVNQLLAANPGDEQAYNLRIEIYKQNGETAKIIDDYQQLIRLRPYNADYYGGLGWYYLEQGEFAKAQDLSFKAYELDRSSMAWTVNLGHSYFLQNDTKKADDYYRQAVSLLTTTKELEQGPLADFDLFIKKGWKIAEAKEKRAWFTVNFSEGQKEANRFSLEAKKLSQAGQFQQAESLFQKAFELRKKILGEKSPLTLTTMLNLAQLYTGQGQYRQAEPLMKETLALTKEVLGDKHPDTQSSMANLAVLYFYQGQYGQAEPLMKETLALQKEVLGNKHPDTLTSMNNLAQLYANQGQYEQAEPLMKKTLALRKEVLGDKHPDTLTSMNGLAQLYANQGQYEQAEPLMKKTLALRKEVLGDKHPGTLRTMNYLAVLYNEQAQYGQAELLYKETLALRKEVLGDKHPDTLISINNLATLHLEQHQYGQAEPLMKETLALQKEVLGDKHPDTLTSMSNLASLYSEQHQYWQAEPLMKETLALTKEVLGDKHPSTLTSMSNLATLHLEQYQYGQAEPLMKETLTLMKEVLGDKHPLTLRNISNLASLYYEQHQYGQAEPLMKEVLALKKEVLGNKHPDTLTSMGYLALLYYKQGQYQQAEPLMKETLALTKEVLGDKHPDTQSSMANLATLYLGQGQYGQAEPLMKETLALEKEMLGNKHPSTLTSIGNLAMLYYEQGQYQQAEPLINESLALMKEVLGDKHPLTLTSMGNLAMLYYKQAQYKQALSLIKPVTEAYRDSLPSLVDDKTNTVLAAQTSHKNTFIVHIYAIDHLQEKAANPDLTGEAFEVGQLAQNPANAQATTQMALAYAANDPETKAELEKLRNAIAYRNVLNKKQIAALSAKGTGNLSTLKTNIDQNEATIKQLNSQLKSTFPTYSQIINPSPIPLADIQRTLAKDEALLVYLTDDLGNFVFVVKHDKALLRRLAVNKDHLQAQVHQLRCAFYSSCEEGKPLQPPVAGQLPEPFDIQLAHQLYQQLLAPIEAELTDTQHLLTVADGPLHSLPFQILVKTLAPDSPKIGKFELSQYQQVDWLVKHFAFSSLPSVKSLAVLRDKEKTAMVAKQPFIGFGDPEFQDKAGDTKGITVEGLFRAGDGKQKQLIELPRLPNTAAELKKLAQSLDYLQYLPDPVRQAAERLGWLKQAVYLQHQASESEVKKLSTSKQLATRVLAFSTHGLLNHEAKQLVGIPAEAGLALPEKNGNGEDGLLTGSEISQLNVNADWVVLSACNTATLEKNSEASGLSELAKAFFLKGSRSLLASHWYVDSATTEYLLSETFAKLKKDPQVPRAQALRQSMLSLINGTSGKFSDRKFAHPLYWAPFVIMGEGGV